jgi:fibronectin type 3 domain-containing protein
MKPFLSARNLFAIRSRRRRRKSRTNVAACVEHLEARTLLSAVSGLLAENASQSETLRFDFGNATSPVADGFLYVGHRTNYSAEQGFGWTDGSIGSRDRGTGGDVNRDLNYTEDGTFVVDLANGSYDVTVTLGDMSFSRDQMGIHLQGQQVDLVDTPAGTMHTATYHVEVADSRLNMRLLNEGGDRFVTITAMEIAQVVNTTPDPDPVPDPSQAVRFDFGNDSSPLGEGHLKITHRTNYSAEQGYGWTDGSIGSRDRASGSDVNRDLNYTEDGTFVVDLANGTYDVTVSLGDMSFSREQMAVFLQGQRMGSFDTDSGSIHTETYRVDVVDGKLTMRLLDEGGRDRFVSITALEIVPLGGAVPDPDPTPDPDPPATTVARFDFGNASSPVSDGYTKISHTTQYTAELGYGWTAGRIGSRDRGDGGDLNRDLNFTEDGTFVVDLANGTYDVTVTLGDWSFSRDEMVVVLQGTAMTPVATAAGSFHTATYRADVVNGQLTLRLIDQGGDRYATITGLEIARVGDVVPDPNPPTDPDPDPDPDPPTNPDPNPPTEPDPDPDPPSNPNPPSEPSEPGDPYRYSRDLTDPYDKYSFDSVQALVNEIRATGHDIAVGHPRIFINSNNKDQLRENIASSHVAWMQELVNLAEKNFGVKITDTGSHSREPAAQPVILANAMIYQLGMIPGVNYKYTRAQYGAEGVRHLVDMASIDTLYIHMEYLALPLGYDWLFELMTNQQRQLVADKLLHYAEPTTDQVRSYNNPPGAELLGALALHGDSQYANQQRVGELLDLFYNGMVFGDPHDLWKFMGEPRQNLEGGRNFTVTQMFMPEGPGIEGLGYSHWYNPFYPILLAWRDQTGEDYFQLPFFQNWVEHFTHLTGNEYEHYDKWWQVSGSLNDRFPRVQVWLEPGLTPSNPDMAALSKHHLYDSNADRFLKDSSKAVYMLLADPNLKAQSPAELDLPLTQHFEGVNNILTRASWEGTDPTWVWFQSPTWGHVRNAGPLNDLQIWKNGAKLLSKHWNWHDGAGTNGTNTVEVYDANQPGMTFQPINARGSGGLGIRLDYGASVKDLSKDLQGYQGGLKYYEDVPGAYMYAFGEGAQTLQQDSSQRNRLELPGWTRQMVYFRPEDGSEVDIFFVMDRFDTGRDTVEAHVPWHYGTNPEIRNRETNAPLGNGQKLHDGVFRYEGADRIVTTVTTETAWGTSDARLFTDTLYPHVPVYHRMGGVETRNTDIFGNLRDGNLKVSGDPNDPANIVQGTWRVQVGPSQPDQHQTYLHVMQATDTSIQTPYSTVLLEGTGVMGAAAAGNLALFSSQEVSLQSGSLTVPSGVSGTHRVLISDLVPGASYDIKVGGTTLTRTAEVTGTVFLDNVNVKSGDPITINRR